MCTLTKQTLHDKASHANGPGRRVKPVLMSYIFLTASQSPNYTNYHSRGAFHMKTWERLQQRSFRSRLRPQAAAGPPKRHVTFVKMTRDVSRGLCNCLQLKEGRSVPTLRTDVPVPFTNPSRNGCFHLFSRLFSHQLTVTWLPRDSNQEPTCLLASFSCRWWRFSLDDSCDSCISAPTTGSTATNDPEICKPATDKFLKSIFMVSENEITDYLCYAYLFTLYYC